LQDVTLEVRIRALAGALNVGTGINDKVTECTPSGLGVLERPRCKKLLAQQLKPIHSRSSPQCRKQRKSEVTLFLYDTLEAHDHSQ
jgi:hypothetical protein